MILVSTNDTTLNHLIGRDFSSQTVGEKKVCFRLNGTSQNFVLLVSRTYQKGSSYIVYTTETAYNFRLNDNERICLGNTVLKDANIKAEVVEEQPAKKSFLKRLFGKGGH